jgi:hypothetical protein
VLNLFGIAAATIDLEQRGTLGPTEMFFPRGGKHEGTGMNPSPGYAPMTMDAQQVDKVKAVGGGRRGDIDRKAARRRRTLRPSSNSI